MNSKNENFNSTLNEKFFSPTAFENKEENSILGKSREEKKDFDNSSINSLFEENKLDDLDNFGNKIEKFVNEFSEKYLQENFISNNLTKTFCRNIIEELFKLQEFYYEDFNRINELLEVVKNFLITYNEKYRGMLKKKNRLNENLESLNIKNEFYNFINREGNKIIKDSIDISRNEINVYRNIFGIRYQKVDILKYTEDLENFKSKLNLFSLKKNL